MSDTIPYSLLRPIWEHVGLKDTEITGFKVDSKNVTFEVIMKLEDVDLSIPGSYDSSHELIHFSVEYPLDREA